MIHLLDVLLLALTLFLSLALLIFSSVTLGRKVTDLEFLAPDDQLRRLQAGSFIRTHANRLLLALATGTLAILVLVDAPVEWRQWTYRASSLAILLAFSASSVLDWIDERRQLYLLLHRDARARARALEIEVDVDRARRERQRT